MSNYELKFLSVSDLHQILEPSYRDMLPSSHQSTTAVQCKLTVGVPVHPSDVGWSGGQRVIHTQLESNFFYLWRWLCEEIGLH